VILKLADRGIITARAGKKGDLRSFFVIDSFVDRLVDAVGAGDGPARLCHAGDGDGRLGGGRLDSRLLARPPMRDGRQPSDHAGGCPRKIDTIRSARGSNSAMRVIVVGLASRAISAAASPGRISSAMSIGQAARSFALVRSQSHAERCLALLGTVEAGCSPDRHRRRNPSRRCGGAYSPGRPNPTTMTRIALFEPRALLDGVDLAPDILGDRMVAVHLAFEAAAREPRIEATTSEPSVHHRQRGIGEQGIARADGIDSRSTKLSMTNEGPEIALLAGRGR